MLMSATALVATAISTPAAGDVTPLSLTVRPPIIAVAPLPYDWGLQQGAARGLKFADGTANCNTGPTATNVAGKADSVHDCGFD
jgi:hypothetical protein